MVRRSKLLLAVVVVTASAGIGLAYFGMIESLVSPEQLPGSPAAGVAAIVAVVVVVLVSRYLDTKAWKAMGSRTGLTAGGRSQFASGPPERSDKPVLTPAVRDAVANVEGEVSVDDTLDNAVGDMLNQLDGGEGGIAGTVAEGMLNMAGETDDGPSRVVQHRGQGLLTDGRTLTRRIDAVTAVADAAEEASAGLEQPTPSGE